MPDASKYTYRYILCIGTEADCLVAFATRASVGTLAAGIFVCVDGAVSPHLDFGQLIAHRTSDCTIIVQRKTAECCLLLKLRLHRCLFVTAGRTPSAIHFCMSAGSVEWRSFSAMSFSAKSIV